MEQTAPFDVQKRTTYKYLKFVLNYTRSPVVHLSIQWRRGGAEGGRPGGILQGAAFEGRKFGILAFALAALQRVSVSLYLFLIYSVH